MVSVNEHDGVLEGATRVGEPVIIMKFVVVVVGSASFGNESD